MEANHGTSSRSNGQAATGTLPATGSLRPLADDSIAVDAGRSFGSRTRPENEHATAASIHDGATRTSGNGSPFAARLASGKRWERLVGQTPAAIALEATLRRAARVDSTILITGETGCGKEEIARAVHAQGPRSNLPFVAVNCGAMAATLIESQLFGHEKGSFTGAVGPSRGVFRAAEGGIVFLDEIGEMPLELQPRLLRVLQQREVTPVGSTDSFDVDVQVIAATNRDLSANVREGTFREDLLYRLNTIELAVPPLRDRVADIPLFVDHFRHFFAEKFGVSPLEPDAIMVARLMLTAGRATCDNWLR